jgi:chorismate synthase
MNIEKDRAQILSGVRFGKTLGSPIALVIENLDWKNWQEKMAVGSSELQAEIPKVEVPRPGHADLAGTLKYGFEDIRNVLERASARETAMRVALGSIARKFLEECGVTIASHVLQLHDVRSRFSLLDWGKPESPFIFSAKELNARADTSPVRCLDAEAEKQMMTRIDEAKEKRDTVGGIFEAAAFNVPVGLGSYVHWDRRLDARLAAAMMSIQAMKGVEVGDGFVGATKWGSEVHDRIYYDQERGYFRDTNNAGGLEGGVTNGQPLVVRVAMKPLSTLMQPLDSVNIRTKEPTPAHIERSDICALPAAGVISEAVLALVLAEAVLEKFGGDSMDEIRGRLSNK